MHSNSRFWIGNHNICEDYSLAGEINNIPCAIISDGCSSAENTDIGSRILAWEAKFHMMSGLFPVDEGYGEKLINSAKESAIQLLGNKLSTHALYSTLIVSYALDNTFHAKFFGDGICAMINKEKIHLTIVEYANGNAPYYLSYLLSSEYRERFEENFGHHQTISTIVIDRKNNSVETETFIEIDEPYNHTIKMPANDWDAGIIMSDGPQQYVNDKMESISIFNVLMELLNFKNYNGIFIERRVNGFLKFCLKNGWRNLDDMSIAGIYLKE